MTSDSLNIGGQNALAKLLAFANKHAISNEHESWQSQLKETEDKIHELLQKCRLRAAVEALGKSVTVRFSNRHIGPIEEAGAELILACDDGGTVKGHRRGFHVPDDQEARSLQCNYNLGKASEITNERILNTVSDFILWAVDGEGGGAATQVFKHAA